MAKTLRKYMGNGDVRNAIRRLGKQMAAELEDKEIWLSAEFQNYAKNITTFILRKHRTANLYITYEPSEHADVAYTDGSRIVLNSGNALAQEPKLLEGRFKVNMGVLFHECAHQLFLDFDTNNKGMDALRSGKLYGKFPVTAGSDLEANLQELEQAMADGYGKAIATIYHEVQNIIADGHDEASMKKHFPGFVAQCINTVGDVMMELAPSLEENLSKGNQELTILFSLILQYAKYGYCKLGEENDDTKLYTQLLSRMEPVIDDALAEDNFKKRWDHINILVLLLWPAIHKVLENSDPNSSGSPSGSGGSGNGGGSLSAEELAQILQSLADAAQADNSAAPAPQGSGKPISSQALAEAASGMDLNGLESLGAILNQLGTEKAATAIQGELDQAQLEAIRKTNRPLIHRSIPVHTHRHHPADKAAYDEIFNDVKPYVKNLISEVQALLREYNEEAIQHHKRYGPIIEATEAYRPDGAFFAKKKLPEDRPNMAMCVLMDESGSMGGSKIQTARKTAIMLEQFASGVGVPLMVAGHYEGRGDNVEINIYSDFVSAHPEKDRYSLAAITSHGCNRDGLPLRLCAEMLAQRPEEIRLMVVISDGAPNGVDYGGEEAFEDIRKTVAEFRRKGLIIYGAAIDEDREVIQSLYGSGFLSITDLKSLPKTMVRLLRQNIV